MTDATSISSTPSSSGRPWQEWAMYRAITPWTVMLVFIAVVMLGWSARNTQMDEAAVKTGEAIASAVGIGESKVLDGALRFGQLAFPIQISERTDVHRLPDLDRDKLPPFAYIETGELKEYDALNDTWEITETEFLVEPVGYLQKVLVKMWETIEMGAWGTIISILISLPLSFFASRNYSPHISLYVIARTWLSFHRSLPELIIALFLVLMYGFGPIAGVLALAIHTSGVLGKFFADEIENAPIGPQQALKSAGCRRLKVLRYAVIPHILPSWIAYVQYVFERNIRTATVLGIVGAGGIGMELKGRWDLFDYSHVATILLVIFLTVVLLEVLSQRLRNRII